MRAVSGLVSVAGPPLVSALGPVSVSGDLHPHPVSVAVSTEVVVLLALRPWDTCELLDAALWPDRRVTSAQRCSAMNRARNWLGVDDTGHAYVPLVHERGYRLHPDVIVDWDLFVAAVGAGPGSATTTDLTRALSLVRGQPLTGINPVRFGWADVDRQIMIAAIADVAAELSYRSLKGAQPRVACWASAIGVAVEPSSEALWQLRLQAAGMSADREQHRRVATQAHLTLRKLGALERATRRLIQQGNLDVH